MLLSSIVKLSNYELSVTKFKAEIDEEVTRYKSLIGRNNTRIPILLKEDTVLANINVKNLLLLVQSGQLDMYEASYIGDGLTLSESYNQLSEEDAFAIESLIIQ